MKITKDDCEKKLEALLMSYLKSEDKLTNIKTANLILDLGFNSFSLVHLIVDIEETFDIHLNEEELDLEQFANFDLMVDVIYDEIQRTNGGLT